MTRTIVRSISPNNVSFRRDAEVGLQVVLLDFGLAVETDDARLKKASPPGSAISGEVGEAALHVRACVCI